MSRLLYCGDVVTTDSGKRAVVRMSRGDRVVIQIADDWTWAWSADLRWDGESLVRVPWTERGWRKLGRLVSRV